MPELPEVETVRRMLAAHLPGRRIARTLAGRHRLRGDALAPLVRELPGRAFGVPRRTGKFLFLDLDDGRTLLSHLGMSGRWLFARAGDDTLDPALDHVHLKLEFGDGARLWYQDVRRFGMLRLVPLARLAEDPSVKRLGPDPLAEPQSAEALREVARGAKVAIKV